MKVKCNKCGYIGPENEFPKGQDFLQIEYIASCPKSECDNQQSAGDASMRMFGGTRPFVFVREGPEEDDNPYSVVTHRSNEAS